MCVVLYVLVAGWVVCSLSMCLIVLEIRDGCVREVCLLLAAVFV